MGERAEYMREWRERNPRLARRHVEANKAHDRALRRLGDMYPNVLERLVNEERPPLYSVPMGRPRKRRSA